MDLNFDYNFDDSVEEEQDLVEEAEKKNSKDNSPEEEIENRKNITEVEELDFDESGDQSESVSDDEDNKETEDANGSKNQSTSPITFSSIAKAFAEEGVFPDLEKDDIENANTAESFVNLVKKQIQAQLDETQQRINKALDAGVDNNAIRSYEGVLGQLNSITDSMLEEESKEGQNLRYQLIQRDFINKGLSPERASKMAQRSIENATDIDDAKEALTSNLEFYKGKYNEIIETAQAQAKKNKEDQDNRAASLKKSILEDEKIFGELQVDKATRQKIFDNISKPIYRNKETGDVFTAVQKYEMDNPTDFLKYVSMCYTLTDGFTDLGKLIGGPVKKEVKKGMKALESKLNNTARNSDGTLDFLSGLRDKESSGSRLELDI